MSPGQRCHHAAERDRQRPTARQRGYDSEYQAAAAEYLEVHPRCECGAPAVLVRHIISIRRRPDLRMDRRNWKPGCRSCNAKDAARDRREDRGDLGTLNDRGRDRSGQPRDIFSKFSCSEKGQSR